jgi:hypothetical protein
MLTWGLAARFWNTSSRCEKSRSQGLVVVIAKHQALATIFCRSMQMRPCRVRKVSNHAFKSARGSVSTIRVPELRLP